MSILKYQRRPTEIEAVRYDGTNAAEIIAWGASRIWKHREHLHIDGIHGVVYAEPGDWVLRTGEEDFYPCPDPAFRELYEVY